MNNCRKYIKIEYYTILVHQLLVLNFESIIGVTVKVYDL